MERILLEVWDELAIRNVVARLALFADDRELEDYVGLYTADAEWLMPGAEHHGRDEIYEAGRSRRAAGQTGPGSATRHLVSTTSVTVSGDTAVAESYWQFFTGTTQTPTLGSMGHYRDHLTRTDDGWLVGRRFITLG